MLNFFRRKRSNIRGLIYKLVNYETARDIIYNSNNILIDVRLPQEYRTMHIENAVNIPVNQLRMNENEYRNKEKIMVYCSSGSRSKDAIMILNSMGYSNIYIWEYAAISNFPYGDMIKS